VVALTREESDTPGGTGSFTAAALRFSRTSNLLKFLYGLALVVQTILKKSILEKSAEKI